MLTIKWHIEKLYVDIKFWWLRKIWLGEEEFVKRCHANADKHLREVFEREG